MSEDIAGTKSRHKLLSYGAHCQGVIWRECDAATASKVCAGLKDRLRISWIPGRGAVTAFSPNSAMSSIGYDVPRPPFI